jgi:membrane protein
MGVTGKNPEEPVQSSALADEPAGNPWEEKLTPAARERIDDLRERGATIYTRADTRSRGILSIAMTASTSFMAARATSSAASMSYYALFSLFPIMIFGIILVGALFGQDRVVEVIKSTVETVLPVGGDIVSKFLTEKTSSSTSIKLISAIVLLWSASSLFVETTGYVALAWESLGAHLSPIRERGLGVLAMLLVIVLLGVIVLVSIVLSIVPSALDLIPGNNALLGAILEPILAWTIPPLLIWLLLAGLYMLAPNVKVWPPAAIWAAGLAALVWQIVSKGFGWWVNSGLTNYQRIYGSLATVITLLFWMYLSAAIILAGAHLCAAIQQHRGPALEPATKR